MLETQCAVIGAGLAGASTAFQLTQRGFRDVIILEQEATAGYHSSGRNAAMIRQVLPDADIGAFAREGAAFIGSAAREWSLPDLFRPGGSILLAGEKTCGPLYRDAQAAQRAGLDVEFWDEEQVEKRVGAARGSRFRAAVFNPSDGTVDVEALLHGFLRKAQAAGCRLFRSREVHRILVDGSRRVTGVKAGDLEVSTPRVVNAAGAWASRIAALAGAAPLSLVPYIRHLVHSGPEPLADPGWPFVWHLEEDVYFRPESGGFLASPCDQSPSEPGDAQPNPDALELLGNKLERAFPALAGIHVGNYWAGHRTFAPDDRFVVGPDPTLRGFYWVAGLGGHGVTTSAVVGALAAQTILDPERDRANPFSPRRFLSA